VPEKSVLTVRAIGTGLTNLSLEILAEGADKAVFVEAQRPNRARPLAQQAQFPNCVSI